MKKEQHTPTPWKACKSNEDFNGPYWELDEDDKVEYAARPYTSIESAGGIVTNAHDRFEFRLGDAEFIVKACNAHEELVEVLGLCRSILAAKARTDTELWRYVEMADAILPYGGTSEMKNGFITEGEI